MSQLRQQPFSLALAGAAVLLAAAALPVAAATLIDTGTPNGSLPSGVADSSNFLAVKFSAASAWAIDSVATYLGGGLAGDQLAIALYADAAGLPGDPLARVVVDFSGDGWNSASDLGWQLPAAGSFWLGIEGVLLEVPVNSGNFVSKGGFQLPSGGITMPGTTAFAAGSGYTAYPGLQFGLQITGAVPEPTTWALLLAGLGVVAAGASRRADRSAAQARRRSTAVCA